MQSTSNTERRYANHLTSTPKPQSRHHNTYFHPSYSMLTSFVKQADDELENPVLAGFEWDKEESWTRLIVHCKKEGAPQPKKKGKKAGQEGDEL